MKRKHKTYSKPKRPFDKLRIEEEGKIKKEFGLKNKKEIWKANAKIKSMREKAKKLIKAPPKEQQALFDQLKKIGLDVNSISDILALEIQNYLERRLQTIVARKGLATTAKSARQMITHRKVLVKGNVVNKPSYIVRVEEEDKITVRKKKKAPKDKASGEKVSAEEREKSPEEEKIGVESSKEIPEQEKAEVAKDNKQTQEEVKETKAEVKGE